MGKIKFVASATSVRTEKTRARGRETEYTPLVRYQCQLVVNLPRYHRICDVIVSFESKLITFFLRFQRSITRTHSTCVYCVYVALLNGVDSGDPDSRMRSDNSRKRPRSESVRRSFSVYSEPESFSWFRIFSRIRGRSTVYVFHLFESSILSNNFFLPEYVGRVSFTRSLFYSESWTRSSPTTANTISPLIGCHCLWRLLNILKVSLTDSPSLVCFFLTLILHRRNIILILTLLKIQ